MPRETDSKDRVVYSRDCAKCLGSKFGVKVAFIMTWPTSIPFHEMEWYKVDGMVCRNCGSVTLDADQIQELFGCAEDK